MKEGIYLGKEAIEIRDLPMPEVGDHDVLIQNIYSSVCGTDVAVYMHGPGTGHKVTVVGIWKILLHMNFRWKNWNRQSVWLRMPDMREMLL